MQSPSRTHRATKVIGTLATLLIGAIIVLTFTRPALTQDVTAWTETTSYPDAITNRNAIVHDGYIYNIGTRIGRPNMLDVSALRPDGTAGRVAEIPLPFGTLIRNVHQRLSELVAEAKATQPNSRSGPATAPRHRGLGWLSV